MTNTLLIHSTEERPGRHKKATGKGVRREFYSYLCYHLFWCQNAGRLIACGTIVTLWRSSFEKTVNLVSNLVTNAIFINNFNWLGIIVLLFYIWTILCAFSATEKHLSWKSTRAKWHYVIVKQCLKVFIMLRPSERSTVS